QVTDVLTLVVVYLLFSAATAPTARYTLSLHDALPISRLHARPRRAPPPRGGSDQLQLEGLQDRAGPVAHAQLAEDVGDVVLDGALGHAEGIGDLLVGEAGGHQAQDLGLAVGERVRAVQADEIVAHVLQAREQALGHRRLDQRAAAGHRADGAHQLLQRDV